MSLGSFSVHESRQLIVLTGYSTKDATVFRLNPPNGDGFRDITRNSEKFVGRIVGKVYYGKVPPAQKGGVVLATQLAGGGWLVPMSEIKIGDEMGIEIRNERGVTHHSRPVISIEYAD